MIIEISVAIIAISIVALVIYAFKVMRTLNDTLQSVRESVDHVHAQLNDTLTLARKTADRVNAQFDDISEQSLAVLRETQALTADLNRKSQHLDDLFSSVRGLGDSVKGIGDSVNEVSAQMVSQAARHRTELGNALALVSFGLETWHKWKTIRNRERDKSEEDS